MGRFKDILSAISPFGILITAFSIGFAVASLIWLLMYFYPTQEKITEYRNKSILLEQDNEKMEKIFNQGDNQIVKRENIIKKQEDEINSFKKALNSKVIENDQLKNRLSKIELDNKQLKQNITDMRRPIIQEQDDQEFIKTKKTIPPQPVVEEPKIESWQQQRRKTGFEINVIEHHTTSILDGAFFITLNKCGKSGVNAIIRAKGYPDLKIENGQAGQDLIFRCSKNYEIRIMSIGANSNFANFFIKEIE